MQELPGVADFEDGRRIAEVAEEAREFFRAGLVRTRGESDQEMAVRFANVARVDGAGGQDSGNLREKTLERRLDDLDFAASLGRAWAHDDRAALGEERRVLDKAAIGMARVDRQHREREAAGGERLAVALVLLERDFRVRRAFAGLGEPGRKVVAGESQKGMRQHGFASLWDSQRGRSPLKGNVPFRLCDAKEASDISCAA